MELLFVLAVFLIFIIYSNKKRTNAAKQLEAFVAVGSEVVMHGGIKGKIVSIFDETVVVETTPGTRIEFVKAAVRTVVAPSLESKPKATKTPATKAATASKKPATPAKKTTTQKAAK